MSHIERITNHCLQVLKRHPCKQILVGYSGGRDSHVLLHALVSLQQQKLIDSDIIAIHVNHQLQPAAQQWVEHCHFICRQLEVKLIVETVITSPQKGESIEAFARTARYNLIKPHVQRGGSFVSAHHRRDQAETFLLQLMRGAGLDGLRSMPLIKPFGAGNYMRPLLDCDYRDIVDYAQTHQLSFINDDSNDDTRFDRNFIRHEVLPLLNSRFPQAERSIARSAAWLAEVPEAPAPLSLSTPTLLKLPLEQQKQRIRAFVKNKTGIALSQTQTDYIIRHHATAAPDKHPVLYIGEFVIRRWKNEILITEKLPDIPTDFLSRDNVGVGKPQIFDNFARLDWQKDNEGLAVGCYQMRALNSRERFHPHWRRHSTTVKKILLEAGIEPWLRNLTPGIYDGQTLIAIPNVGVATSHYEKSENAAMPWWIIERKFVRL